eukprot:TRINITY_DN9227_c0_g1_i1.p1 TRINITY_DN9227_c0_g1~~TRINITY_DN9227_c0_g1_i1.p1  ORF type:complete len:140 (-),score=13.51 TRINITY_DN9227_c0_g1_i1:36-455(-)
MCRYAWPYSVDEQYQQQLQQQQAFQYVQQQHHYEQQSLQFQRQGRQSWVGVDPVVGGMYTGQFRIENEQRWIVDAMITGQVQIRGGVVLLERCMITGTIKLFEGARLELRGGMLTGSVHLHDSSSFDCRATHVGRVLRM